MHALGRKIAFYFVIPVGLLANATGYPQHGSMAVTRPNHKSEARESIRPLRKLDLRMYLRKQAVPPQRRTSSPDVGQTPPYPSRSRNER